MFFIVISDLPCKHSRKNHSTSVKTRLLQTSAARSGAQGKVGSYIIINLQIWDVSRRYQLALSLTNQNKQLYLPQSHCLFCFHSRFTFIRSTLGSKDKLKLSLGRASAERKSGRSDRPQTRVFSPVQTARVTKSASGTAERPPDGLFCWS